MEYYRALTRCTQSILKMDFHLCLLFDCLNMMNEDSVLNVIYAREPSESLENFKLQDD